MLSTLYDLFTVSLKEIFPRMHGATSIWVASLILSAPWLSISEWAASLSLIFAVGSGHRAIFVGRAEKLDYAVLGISGLLILQTALSNPVIFAYAVPLILAFIFRKDFRKYVIFSSVLTAMPSAYIPFIQYHILFVAFALSYVLVADSLIYSDLKTAIIALAIFVPVSVLINPMFTVFSAALLIPMAGKFRTKTLGLYLLSTLITFSVFELLIIYHYFLNI